MRFAVISSGSKANCTYLEAGSTRILIDCGLSARETCRRLSLLGVDPQTLDAIVVTHEHSDHIKGIRVMSKQLEIPVYANRRTARALPKCYGREEFETGASFSIGCLTLSPFSIVHDAADPVGFVVTANGLKFAQATDLGRITPLVRDALSGCNAVVLESNHDQEMLWSCDYPWVLKQRIHSSHGHLSNDTAASFVNEVLHDALHHLVLGHLSENSNTPELALQTLERHVDEGWRRSAKRVRCADIYNPTPLLAVDERLPESDTLESPAAVG